MAVKNLAGKSRKLSKGEAPYEVWLRGAWRFLVIKKNQVDDDKPYAIWNVGCVTPMERDMAGHDTYVSDIKGSMNLVWRDPIYALALENQGVRTSVDTSPDGWKRYTR